MYAMVHRQRPTSLQAARCASGFRLYTLLLCLLPLSVLSGSLPEPLSSAHFPPQKPAQVKLGQLLFHDKILSGNKNIACGTCHHQNHAGGDALSLGIGEGGAGIGPERTPGVGDSRIRRRIPRNAPALWNLGARQINILFHDGRLSLSDDYGTGFNSPAEERLPDGLSGLLAAQALFPLASRFEMAGDPEENSVARAAFDRIDHVWPIITRRVQAIPGYTPLFMEAFDHVNSSADITIVDIANALAAFQAFEWRSYDSPFDAYLAGDASALTGLQREGMQLFYGEAGCDGCHAGALLTDQQFYALGLPVFGPGRTRRWDPMARDTGRMAESDRLEDSYRFRTPSLRNVELTGPYGHNGAYQSLDAIILHHLDPQGSRDSWVPQLAALPYIPWLNPVDLIIHQDRREMQRYERKLDIQPQSLSQHQVNALVAFMRALTGKTARATPLGRPDTVPSALPVD